MRAIAEPSTRSSSRRTRRRNAVLIIGILLTVAGGLLIWCCSSTHLNRHKLYVLSMLWGLRDFDSTEWKSHGWKSHGSDDAGALSVDEGDRRGEMLFKLLWTHDLIGMTREEVTQLLGQPDTPRGGYLIGFHTGIARIDPDALVFEYDESGRVSDFYSYQL